MNTRINTIEEYIASFPQEVQELLIEMHRTIKKNAPDAVESISYGMPAYKTCGKPLVYFAAFAKHIGFYATPSGHSEFVEELKKYKTGKGSVQFPINEKLPLGLVARMVKFKVKENKKNNILKK